MLTVIYLVPFITMYIYTYTRNDKNAMRLYPAQNGPIIVTLNLFYLQWSENSKKGTNNTIYLS